MKMPARAILYVSHRTFRQQHWSVKNHTVDRIERANAGRDCAERERRARAAPRADTAPVPPPVVALPVVTPLGPTPPLPVAPPVTAAPEDVMPPVVALERAAPVVWAAPPELEEAPLAESFSPYGSGRRRYKLSWRSRALGTLTSAERGREVDDCSLGFESFPGPSNSSCRVYRANDPARSVPSPFVSTHANLSRRLGNRSRRAVLQVCSHRTDSPTRRRDTLRQYLRARLRDELHPAVAPIVLGCVSAKSASLFFRSDRAHASAFLPEF